MHHKCVIRTQLHTSPAAYDPGAVLDVGSGIISNGEIDESGDEDSNGEVLHPVIDQLSDEVHEI
jgi:hypothetical protein